LTIMEAQLRSIKGLIASRTEHIHNSLPFRYTQY
jgi:hypothetical protein